MELMKPISLVSQSVRLSPPSSSVYVNIITLYNMLTYSLSAFILDPFIFLFYPCISDPCISDPCISDLSTKHETLNIKH